ALWTPVPMATHLGDLPSPSVITNGTIVVVASDPHTILAAAAREGAEPLWRRSWPDRQLGSLYIIDGQLICVDRVAHRAAVVEMSSGMLLREYIIPVAAETVGGNEDPETSNAPVRSGHNELFTCVGRYLLRADGESLIARRAATG